MLYDVIQPCVGVIQPPGTTLTSTMRTTTGNTLEGSQSEFSLDSNFKSKRCMSLNEDYYMTAPGMVASQLMKQMKCHQVNLILQTLTIFTPTDFNNLSPVIDTKRMSLFLIQNRLNNPISGTTPDFVAETANTGGSSAAQYVTKTCYIKR